MKLGCGEAGLRCGWAAVRLGCASAVRRICPVCVCAVLQLGCVAITLRCFLTGLL